MDCQAESVRLESALVRKRKAEVWVAILDYLPDWLPTRPLVPRVG